MGNPPKSSGASDQEPEVKPARPRGRPKSADADRKDTVLRIRLTEAQRVAFEEAASLAKQDVSAWLRALGEREATRAQKAAYASSKTAAPPPPAETSADGAEDPQRPGQ